MIEKNHIFQNLRLYVLLVLVFLLPTQLAYHVWPDWSFVFGIRIDYLAVRLYLTDLLIFLYLFIFFFTSKANLFIKKKHVIFLLGFIIFSTINIIVSDRREISFLKWIKILELILFAFFVSKEKLNRVKPLIKTFCYSIIFFSSIGLTQFIKGSTIGGILYYFGERSFGSLTPGISLLYFANYTFLRPYSTFSHPNSFAGYLLVSLLLITLWKDKECDKTFLKNITITLGFLLFFLCFSKTAFISLIVVLFIKFFSKKLDFSRVNILQVVFITAIILSMSLPVISTIFLDKFVFSKSITERLVLSKASGIMFSKYPVFGVGMNNFINFLPKTYVLKIPYWFLQPVHNIFLLILSEVGIFGFCIFFLYSMKIIDFLKENNSFKYSSILIVVIVISIFDHYWITLQQNLLLLSLILGLSKNKQIK